MRKYIISFEKPAENFNEALPVGNGRFGGMVYGKPYTELINLNEDSVWFGGPRDRNNPSAKENLPRIRQLINEGRITEAQDLCALALSGTPEEQRHYEALGNLYIQFAGKRGEITDYKRELNLNEAAVTVSFKRDGTEFTRKVFTSFPSQVMAVRLEADKKASISFRTQLARGGATWDYGPYEEQVYRNPGYNSMADEIYNVGSDTTVMRTSGSGRGSVEAVCAIKVINEGGIRKAIGNTIAVEAADAVTLLVAADTTFREDDPCKSVLQKLESAASKGFEELYKEHISDYTSLFDRVRLELYRPGESVVINYNGSAGNEGQTIKDKEQWLPELFFMYGRYLMIAGSRPGSLPLNLQGIWNDSFNPAWGSKYTININAQMNYWPAGVANLSECQEPLIDMLERMKENGRKTAEVMYGCRGFMAHHNTDIWCDTAPQDVCLSSTYWVMGAAWLSLHIWEQYLFTRDIDFLKKHYDTMKEAARFIIDYLIEDDEYLVTSPTISPENEYILPNGERGVVCKGASMDNQIAAELFNSISAAAAELKWEDDKFLNEIKATAKRLAPIKIGRFGQIMEWNEDYEEINPGHRHISHLFALYPGNLISPERTPELAEAAKVTLKRRLSNGGGHTGWSRAWIINMWARLNEAEEAFKNVMALLNNSTLPNLFDNHPPFQIDGNFGGAAGIAEMLVYSTQSEVKLLPALPKEWKDGCLYGFRLRTGQTIGKLVWKDGKVTEYELL